MPTSLESGHAINVANFNFILADLSSYGDTYNPTNKSLNLTALKTLLINAENSLGTVNTAEAGSKLAISARKAEFKKLSPLLTRVNNAVKATDTNPKLIEAVQNLVRKMQGRRASPKKSEEEKKLAADAGKRIIEISSSQMSYDLQVENFGRLIKLVSSLEFYAPNEADIKVATLESLHNLLKTINKDVITTKVILSNARIARNNVLYKPDTGLVDIALSCKAYIKAVFGTVSPEYIKLSKVKFTYPR
jgi:hypothetical protein